MTDETTSPQHPMMGDGDTGPAVTRLQKRLAELGHDPGAADGVFGKRTHNAVVAFQAAAGLAPDGLVGPLTYAALYPHRTPDLPGMHAISRLIAFNGRGKYVLGAGGTNPRAATPFTWRNSLNGSDCIGAVCWALGIPRSTPSFPEYEGDIGVDSALMDAGLLAGGKGGRKFFAPVDRGDVVPGCLVAFPSIRARELWRGTGPDGAYEPGDVRPADKGWKPSDRVRIGHIGLIVGWEGLTDPFQLNDHPWDGDLASLVTLECRSSWPAVRLGRNVSFLGNTTYKRGGESWGPREEWGARFMRFALGAESGQ